VAATHRPIDKALASGELREDFYFRLAVVTFSLPPLRRRREDIRPLVEHFMGRCGASFGRDDIAIDPLALDILESYSWPGNVRELENVIERAVLLADDEVRPEHLGIRVALDLSALDEVTRTLPEITACAVRRVEEEAIARALEIAHGNKTKAAQALGVSYKTLLLKVREYNLEPDRSSQGSS
jgi:DNA-binding NtrC family response regulator